MEEDYYVQMVSLLRNNLPFGLRTVLLLPANQALQIPAGPPPAPASGPAFRNNEGNNNELKSPPIGKQRGRTTCGEFTPDAPPAARGSVIIIAPS